MSCCPCPFTIYHFIALQLSLHRQLLLYCPSCCHIDCIHRICHIYRICRKVPNLLPCQISIAVPTAIIEAGEWRAVVSEGIVDQRILR